MAIQIVVVYNFIVWVRKLQTKVYGLVDNSTCIFSAVKPVLSGQSKVDKTKVLMANGSLMKVESIAEYCPWSILQYV